MGQEKIRSKCYMLILYPFEDENHRSVFEIIKSSYDCAYILHDKDLKENSLNEFDFKKPHYHIVLYFSNARYLTGVCKKLGIEANYVTSWDSRDKALLYLVHKNNPDKYQYSIDSVGGNLKKVLIELLSSIEMTDLESITLFRDYIFSFRGHLKLSDLLNFAIRKGLIKYYKKFYLCLRDLVDEHNYYIK